MENILRGSRRSAGNSISEAETIRLACEGNPNAFECLYKVHNRRVYGLCFHIARNPTEAEDLTQEVFLQLFRKIHTFRAESRFSTWLHRLAVNVVLMQRRKKRYPEVSLDVQPDEDDYRAPIELGGPDLWLSGALDRVNLNNAIDQLPNGYKEIFVLFDIAGYEHKEIARILGCSVGNSKSQLFKARLRLRQLLQEVLRSQARERRELRCSLLAPVQRQGSGAG